MITKEENHNNNDGNKENEVVALQTIIHKATIEKLITYITCVEENRVSENDVLMV